MTETNPQTSFDDLCLPKAFVKQNPELFTDSQINWLIKTRHKNGLVETGAVLKISRKIYLKKSIFLDWFLNQKAA
ncbi:MAG: hypothetical protein V3U87_15205 [Methylococcaceae bacterium]